MAMFTGKGRIVHRMFNLPVLQPLWKLIHSVCAPFSHWGMYTLVYHVYNCHLLCRTGTTDVKKHRIHWKNSIWGNTNRQCLLTLGDCRHQLGMCCNSLCLLFLWNNPMTQVPNSGSCVDRHAGISCFTEILYRMFLCWWALGKALSSELSSCCSCGLGILLLCAVKDI